MARYLTFANVMSVTAVFIALGGGAYAVTLSKNEVRSKHIRNGQVKRADIARNAINSSRVANGRLLAEDFAAGQLPAGPAGPEGPAGNDGQQGPPGTARAYAFVDIQNCGSVLPAACQPEKSKGISSVTRMGSGQYCVVAPGIDAAATPAFVTVDNSSEDPGDASANVSAGSTACGANGFSAHTTEQHAISVRNASDTGSATALAPDEASHDVSFTIVIP